MIMHVSDKITFSTNIPVVTAIYLKSTRFFALALILLAVLITSSATMSQTLKIVTIQLSPFGFMTEDNKPTGMMYEISNLIAKEAGLSYENRIVPYVRTSYAVANGTADFVLRFTNKQLQKDAIQVVSVVAMQNIVVGLAGSEYRSLSDLHGKTVANLKGAIFDKQFTADVQILKYDVRDYGQGLKMLFAKREIDGVIGSNVGVYYSALKLGYSPNQLSKPLALSSKHFWLHFSKKNEDKIVIAALKDAIERLKEKGAIKKIINKYIGDFTLSLE